MALYEYLLLVAGDSSIKTCNYVGVASRLWTSIWKISLCYNGRQLFVLPLRCTAHCIVWPPLSDRERPKQNQICSSWCRIDYTLWQSLKCSNCSQRSFDHLRNIFTFVVNSDNPSCVAVYTCCKLNAIFNAPLSVVSWGHPITTHAVTTVTVRWSAPSDAMPTPAVNSSYWDS